MNPIPKLRSVLATDCGSTTTKAILIEEVDALLYILHYLFRRQRSLNSFFHTRHVGEFGFAGSVLDLKWEEKRKESEG